MEAPRSIGGVIWLTGLSGSGKTTISRWLGAHLRTEGHRVEELDGDDIRQLFPATGFSRTERDAHVRRVAYMASRLEYHGVFVVVSLISPYRDCREFARGLCQNFLEVHVSTPLAVCEARDAKGLYARARRGELTNFTGVDDLYEAPLNPDLAIDTTSITIDQAGRRVLEALQRFAWTSKAPPMKPTKVAEPHDFNIPCPAR